jgi:hypothetical protein
LIWIIEPQEERARSTLNLNDLPFSQTDKSEVYSSVNGNGGYHVPRLPYGYRGAFDSYWFVDIQNEVLETFVGNHCFVAFRMRGPHKQYGVLRYFQLPDDSIQVNQVRAIKRSFYDDVHDEIDEWVFVFLNIGPKVIWMIFQQSDLVSQTHHIEKVRLEIIPCKGREIDIEKDIRPLEEIIYDAVANIDSWMMVQSWTLDPDDFVYALEIQSEIYSPIQKQKSSRDDLDITGSKLESRMIESGNSFNIVLMTKNKKKDTINQQNDQEVKKVTMHSSAISNVTNLKKYDGSLNDGSYFQSPVNIGKQQTSHAYNPSTSSGYEPNPLTEISYNPFDAHMRRFSPNASNEGRRYENVNKSAISINENDKSMTPDYNRDYNARGIERLGNYT